MKMNKLNREFGVDAKNKIGSVNQKSFDGAIAGLETFYFSFNNKDIDTFKKVWYNNDLVQLNNPLGGIVRGIEPIVEVYDTIFNGRAKVWVKFTDILYYATDEMVVFAGTEIGEFSIENETVDLKIRTSRIFGYLDNEKRWFQLHHHGSIDDSDLLYKYQKAVKK
jgi:limonene-1,2-epoxide hydrolase